ncbi:43kDa postsynaptic protein [Parasponia andersonii]|uniref:RING-type E3 ubiquitin transferase n=1 Tax=Parasponia andersonii TaxID=3476 RepID=A0A2P5C4S9_PARAD|nr:43kDa postsynaptic protein [Parasponia andersonii]
MVRHLLQTEIKPFLSPTEQSYFFSQPPPPSNIHSDNFNLNSKVNPSILLIIVILAIIFFVSGLLHLLVRFLLRPPNRDPDDLESVSALQGQLQQLFHLHDAGVDQSFIDTLPVFHYKAIIGLKNPFDCAVCLCEFEPEDKLRLLPKCSHAFHMDCIDTWLLSHSTCPLCRASLLPDFSPNTSCSPIVLVLESGSESSREIVTDREVSGHVSATGRSSSTVRQNAQMSFREENEFGATDNDVAHKSGEIAAKNDDNRTLTVDSGEKVVTVKLGKFRNVDGGEGSSNSTTSTAINGDVDGRRCFSMGSFAYVMDESSSLQVPIRTPLKKQSSKKPNLPLKPGHRAAISECDCDSQREFEFHGVEESRNLSNSQMGSRNLGQSSKRESFSISKIWLRSGKNENQNGAVDSSRRAFSFRFPIPRNSNNKNNSNGVSEEDLKSKNGNAIPRRTVSGIEAGRWGNGRNELGYEEENQSCNSLDSQLNTTPSFARRTLLWLMGRQNKVVHSSFDPNP